MARHLTTTQAAHYRNKGYVFPLPALEAGETRELRRRVDKLRLSCGGTPRRARADKLSRSNGIFSGPTSGLPA